MQEAGTGFIGDAQSSNWTYSHESRPNGTVSICHKSWARRRKDS